MTDTIGNQKNDVNKPIDCPMNILEFQKMFPDETACIKYLERMRWPDGFCCSKCSQVGEPFKFSKRPHVLRCKACHDDTSITANTVMHRSKTDILVWFWAAHLVATQTPGVSALELQKKLGEEWPLELDIVYVGGKTKSGISGKTSQTPVIIAVELKQREIRDPITKKIKQRAQAGRIRLQTLPNKMAVNVNQFAQNCISSGASIVSDDGAEFSGLSKLGFKHEAVAMRGDKIKMDSTLPMISVVTANLKTWIDGTFHGVIKKHLQAYLNEFMFRFNRRFYRAISFRSLLELGALTPGVTYKDVYGKSDAKIGHEFDIG